jgi:uncharacterized heparinase superfamily protein
VDWGPDRWQLYRLGLSEVARAVTVGLAASVEPFRLMRRQSPRGQLISPQDLRTSDPTIASDIYAGLFVFAGRALATGGRSPFDFAPPSREWGEALYGFGWLRHLRAADSALARANARALMDEFARGRGNRRAARDKQVTARRLISLLSQAPLLLEGADYEFYQRYLRLVASDARDLEGGLRRGALPQRRLSAAIGLSFAGLCCEGFERTLRRATRLLARELSRQVLPDGGHISRNPRQNLDLLLDLLPLRQTYLSRGLDPPRELVQAIDRMLPFLRLLRHPDGSLGHFNGMGAMAAGHLATLLFYDDARGRPMQHAPHAGYERLETPSGNLVVTVDVGLPPPVLQSARAHAGCLSFEMSSGSHRIVVNCGAPLGGDEVRQAARATAAHSTAAIGETSSCRFLASEGWWLERRLANWLLKRLGPVLLRGPVSVRADRGEKDGANLLTTSHDGYRPTYGIVHERRLRLPADGERVEGEDNFVRDPAKGGARPEITVRFHLHPGVKASRVAAGRIVMLVLPNRETWEFEAEAEAEPQLEEGVFFAATEGGRRTDQIVLRLPEAETALRWRFRRIMPGSIGRF